MTFKQYLEQHHDWEAVAVNARTQSITYTFRNRRHGGTLTMECLPSQSTILTYGSERKTIPSIDDVSKAYGRKATEDDMIRLFDQVLERMEESQKTEDRRFIEGAFKRHARQKM